VNCSSCETDCSEFKDKSLLDERACAHCCAYPVSSNGKIGYYCDNCCSSYCQQCAKSIGKPKVQAKTQQSQSKPQQQTQPSSDPLEVKCPGCEIDCSEVKDKSQLDDSACAHCSAYPVSSNGKIGYYCNNCCSYYCQQCGKSIGKPKVQAKTQQSQSKPQQSQSKPQQQTQPSSDPLEMKCPGCEIDCNEVKDKSQLDDSACAHCSAYPVSSNGKIGYCCNNCCSSYCQKCAKSLGKPKGQPKPQQNQKTQQNQQTQQTQQNQQNQQVQPAKDVQLNVNCPSCKIACDEVKDKDALNGYSCADCTTYPISSKIGYLCSNCYCTYCQKCAEKMAKPKPQPQQAKPQQAKSQPAPKDDGVVLKVLKKMVLIIWI